MKEQIQTVIITLSDGREVSYTGKYQIPVDKGEIRMVNIKVTPPIDMPKDCNFATIEDLKK